MHEFGTNCIREGSAELAYMRSLNSLHFLHAQSMDVNEDSNQNLGLKLDHIIAWAFIRDICAYEISTKNLCTGLHIQLKHIL